MFLRRTTTDRFMYKKGKQRVTITGYTGGERKVSIPDAIEGLPVTAIGNKAFARQGALTSVIIPASVTAIGGSAFARCANLKSVIIPERLIYIGNSAFSGCARLKSAAIPAAAAVIGTYVFAGCARLSAINVDRRNAAYSSVDGVLFTKKRDALIVYPAAKKGQAYTVPDSVTEIKNGAFYGCAGLKSVIIPDGVTDIACEAFARCANLKRVTLSAETWMENGAFPVWVQFVYRGPLSGDSRASCGGRVCNFSRSPLAAPQRASMAKGRSAGSISGGFGGTGSPKFS
ncbi:MAG: leucine-rich repeat domain-containing protein [Spirochaetaceae bacterium]|jgi:hypothetical protein|nr:leucine-rich repeat domain-containing protein [Spirochaetaceae bacterium]